MDIAGSTALVTGASSGIGRAVALALARNGAHIVGLGRDLPALQSLAESSGATVLQVDLESTLELTRFVEETLSDLPPIDILINCAGSGRFGPGRTERDGPQRFQGRFGGFQPRSGRRIGGDGVGVTVVIPGVVQTPFFERRGAPYDRAWPRLLPPERVAQAIVRAIARDRAEVVIPGWLRPCKPRCPACSPAWSAGG